MSLLNEDLPGLGSLRLHNRYAEPSAHPSAQDTLPGTKKGRLKTQSVFEYIANPMLQLVTTADGSSTIFNPDIGEHYHSKHGALQESRHVFLNSGLKYNLGMHPGKKEINIMEVGFGTGLNFLISAHFCTTSSILLKYTGIEAYPLQTELLGKTGYNQYVQPALWDSFLEKYPASLTAPINITILCNLQIIPYKLLEFDSTPVYDILYFDAFAAVHQPEMWSDQAIEHACRFLKPGGVFVTYAITGNLKRCMKALGFSIEKAPGATGKREMLRAIKNSG